MAPGPVVVDFYGGRRRPDREVPADEYAPTAAQIQRIRRGNLEALGVDWRALAR